MPTLRILQLRALNPTLTLILPDVDMELRSHLMKRWYELDEDSWMICDLDLRHTTILVVVSIADTLPRCEAVLRRLADSSR